MTQREDDKRVRRGNDATKGATVVFWRLAGGDEEELLALRVLLLDLVAILRSVRFSLQGNRDSELENRDFHREWPDLYALHVLPAPFFLLTTCFPHWFGRTL